MTSTGPTVQLSTHSQRRSRLILPGLTTARTAPWRECGAKPA
ncbi:hypothetical protein ACQEUX_03795 [Micromonospora sp. CA-259024]